MNAIAPAPIKTARKNRMPDLCKFCGSAVNLNDEGETYRDGTCAHEGCADGNSFRRANEADFRD